jgi:hypothetical protein
MDAVIKLICAFEGRGYYLPKILVWCARSWALSRTRMVLQGRVYMGGLGLCITGHRWISKCPLHHISGAGAAHTCGLAHLCFS